LESHSKDYWIDLTLKGHAILAGNENYYQGHSLHLDTIPDPASKRDLLDDAVSVHVVNLNVN